MVRDLDIILFGATGFTGKHAIPILTKLLSETNSPKLTWGVAGRSEKKLKDLLKHYEKETGTPLDNIPIIIANIEDEESLKAMARKARIIINCCGPYRFYGEPVVKACVEEGTHHVDVSGEPQYMEGMQLKYHQPAQEKGIFIISACGFDSIPTDLGVIFLQQNFSGTLNSVSTYLSLWHEGGTVAGPLINYGTWESAIYGIAHWDDLRDIRRQLFTKKLPTYKPKLQIRNLPHKNDLVSGFICPFPGSDRSVIKRSQRCFYENESKRPIQIGTYVSIPSWLTLITIGIFGLLFSLLAKFQFGRNLLLKYPEKFSGGVFSHDSPKEETLTGSRFSITLYGEGWKEPLPDGTDNYSSPVDTAISAKVKGSNPGYVGTCLCLVLAAVTILTEREKLPHGGGVYPPGYAFAKTSLIKQLNENGLTFEILQKQDLPTV